MADKATGESTPNDPSKIGPPIWLSLEDAFQQLRARSGLSREAANDLYGILCDGDCSSVWVSTGAWCSVSVGFWRDLASLFVVFNVVDGVDHLNVDYPDYAFDHLNYLSDDRGTFFVRAADFVRELERLHPTPAAPPPVVQAAPVQQSKNMTTAGPDRVKTGPDRPRSKGQQTLRDAADETFPGGWCDLPTRMIIKKASDRPKVKALNPAPKYDTWLRALDRRLD
jgi:hypothetical protein